MKTTSYILNLFASSDKKRCVLMVFYEVEEAPFLTAYAMNIE